MTAEDEGADRAAVYRLLGRLFLAEPDAPLVGRMREWPPFAEAIGGEADEAAAARLRTEYTRLFLLNVYPYESVFLDESVMLGAAPSVAVEAAYAAAGFEVSGVPRPGAPDHVGAELWFAAALVDGAPVDRRRFLEAHLGAFVAPFAEAVRRDARHPFYRVLAELTAGVVLSDLARLGAGRLPIAGEPAPAAEPRVPPRGSLAGADLAGVGRHLATPLLAGLFLSRETLHRLAARLALPLALLERPRMVEVLFEGAARFGQLSALLGHLEAEARGAAATYAGLAADHPGAAGVLGPWQARADATADDLAAMRRDAAR